MLLIYIVPVVSMTLTRTPIKIFARQKMNMTCMTSYSNPPALWYMSSLDITSQSTSKTQKEGGLERTISSLISITMKKDNERQVYCKASNTLSQLVTSSVQTLIVMCKFIELHSQFVCDFKFITICGYAIPSFMQTIVTCKADYILQQASLVLCDFQGIEWKAFCLFFFLLKIMQWLHLQFKRF